MRVMPGRRHVLSVPLLVLLVLLLPLLLAGCAGAPSAPSATPSARLQLQLAPAALGSALSLQQHLRVERDGRTDELDTVLEIDPGQINLVGLAFGQRVLTLQYDGKQLKTWRHFMLPSQVQGEDVLRDVQLTFWPATAIRAALPAGWELQESTTVAGLARQRTLWLDHALVTQIDYPGQQAWDGKVVLTNLPFHYKLTIQSVLTAP